MKRRGFVSLRGGAAAWPLPLRAQQAMPVVGFFRIRGGCGLPVATGAET
jgi:hypothetical protein